MKKTILSHEEYVTQIAKGLAKVFKKQPEKITYWLLTPNLNLGGASPCHLIALGRIHKVAHFVADAVGSNKP